MEQKYLEISFAVKRRKSGKSGVAELDYSFYLYNNINDLLSCDYITIKPTNDKYVKLYEPIAGIHKIDNDIAEMLESEDKEIVSVGLEILKKEILKKREGESTIDFNL